MQRSTNELTTECISRADYFEKFRGFENQFQSPFKDVTTPNSMRNRITGQLLKAFLNHKIKDFGKMTTLHIDTQEKHISLTANLLGETEPIDASLKYTLQESDGRTFFVPTELNCSRHWLSLLAQQMLKDNVIRFEIPSGIAATMVKVLKI